MMEDVQKKSSSRRNVFLFIVIVLQAKNSVSDILQCYKCSVSVEKYIVDNTTITTPLCSKFEKSNSYAVHCPYSTMCLKTITILHLQNGQEQETITRGCAQQKNTTQIFRNKQWEQEHLVQEVYDVGCKDINTVHIAGSAKKKHCYCRGNLCNSSSYVTPNINMLIITFLWILLCI